MEEEQKELVLTPAQAWFVDPEVEFIEYDPERSQEEPYIARIKDNNSTYALTVAPIDAQTLSMQG